MADPSDALAMFVSITGADQDAALSMLEATNWEVQEAVNLFFATQAAGGTGAGPSAPPAAHEPPYIPPDDEDIRAPMAARVDKLYDDTYMPMQRQQRRPRPPQVEAFRDFRTEASGPDAEAQNAHNARLAEMFKPPNDIIFPGDFEKAKAAAAQQNKWIMINVQSNAEFASHQLNRDTWSNETVKEFIKGSFIFLQAYNTSDLGEQAIRFYKIAELPAIIIIDPMTGARLLDRTGFVKAETLIEELVPFLDHGPKDAGSQNLAQATLKRNASRTDPSRAAKPRTEEEELALAVAMSLEQAKPDKSVAGTSVAATFGSDDEDAADFEYSAGEDDEDAKMYEQLQRQYEEEERQQQRAAAAVAGASPPRLAAKTAEQVQAEAAQQLPPEPAEGAAGCCRVAFRMPDGSRQQRRFLRTAPVAELFTYCVSQLAEAAGGRRFSLSGSYPGAAALEEQQQSLEEAGAANAMLVVKWV